MRRRKPEEESLLENGINGWPQNGNVAKRKVQGLYATKQGGGATSLSLTVVLVFFRLAGCILFACGMYLGRTQLCTHEECDMTYSMRMFLELDMKRSRSSNQHSYRLYKFIDQRDPRHTKFQRQTQPLQGNEWCLVPQQTVAVLYVPGHGGSYQQSRSLGAHGTQLTGQHTTRQQQQIVHALGQNYMTGNATSLESFTYDVYALDFDEEGAGLHGTLVQHQSAMVADAVEYLAQTCQLQSIHIVAHSIGGYAARLALVEYPEIQATVSNVITLATPHAQPVLAVESTLHRVHTRLYQEIPNVAMISIGGGLRDEMIPPSLCESKASLNVAAVDIMSSGSNIAPLLGMDHRAIVWCHNLLSTIRGIIFTLAQQGRSEDSAQERIQHVSQRLGLPGDYDYSRSVDATRQAFVSLYGYWGSMVIEVGLLYSLERLVSLYSMSSAMYTILGMDPWASLIVICTVPVLVMHGRTSDSLTWGSTFILMMVANTTSTLLFIIAKTLSTWLKCVGRVKMRSFGFATFVTFSVIFVSLQYFISGLRLFSWSRFIQAFVLALVPTTIFLHLHWTIESLQSWKFVYFSWVLVTIPLFSVGLFYGSLIRHRELPVLDLTMILLPVATMPFYCEGSTGDLQNTIGAIILLALSIMQLAPGSETLQCMLALPLFACNGLVFSLAK